MMRVRASGGGGQGVGVVLCPSRDGKDPRPRLFIRHACLALIKQLSFTLRLNAKKNDSILNRATKCCAQLYLGKFVFIY